MIGKMQLKKLQKLQDTAMSYINPRLPATEIAKQHKILSINDLILLEHNKIWYKLYTNSLPRNLQDVMTTDHRSKNLLKGHGYATRNKKEINLPKVENRTYRGSFLFKGL